MAASFAMRPGDRIFFIYDRSVVKKEEDDPKDAIVYFYPQTTTLNVQCIFCCQIVGMYNLTKSITGSTPKLFKLRRSKVATVHEGKFTLALACKLRTPDAAILSKLENLYRVFAFYHCSITNVQRLYKFGPVRVFKERPGTFRAIPWQISGTKEAFLSNMNAIWDFYVPYVRRYGNTVPGIFEPIQHVRLLKGGNCLFLRCSHLLQWMKSQPSLLAGCILYKRSVLCTQLTPELTSHLLLIKPNQHHHPSQSVTDTVLPFGVRIMKVYVTKQQYCQILTPSQPCSKSTCCATPEAEDVFHTPPTSLTEKVDGETQTPNGTPSQPKRKLSSKAGKLLSNFTGMLEGTVWQSTSKSKATLSRSRSSSGGKKGGSLQEGSPSASLMKDVNDAVLSRNSSDVVEALQAKEGFPESKLSGIPYRECQAFIPSQNQVENKDPRKVVDIPDCSVTLPNSSKSEQDETELIVPPVSQLANSSGDLEACTQVEPVSQSDVSQDCTVRQISHCTESSHETGFIKRNNNEHLQNRVSVEVHEFPGMEGDTTIIEEHLTPAKDAKTLHVDVEAINGSTDCPTENSSGVVIGGIDNCIAEQRSNHLHRSDQHLHNSEVPVKEATGKCSNSTLESPGADRPDLLRSRSDEHRDNPDLLQSSSIKTFIRSDEWDQRAVQDLNASLKCHQCETPAGEDLPPEAKDAASGVTLGEETDRGSAMNGEVETNLYSESEKLDGDDERKNLGGTNTEDSYPEMENPNTKSGDHHDALDVADASENAESITPDIPEDFQMASEQRALPSGVGSSEEQPGSEECYHQNIVDGDGSVGSSESDKTLQCSSSTSGIESKEEGDAAEEVEEVREQLIEAKEEPSEDMKNIRSQDLKSDTSASLDKSEPAVEDLVNVSLYVQAHSDTTLLFLADKSIMREKHMLNTLWQSILRELGELELRLKNVVRPDRSLDCKSAYNFIHFDNHSQTLEGNIVNPVSQTESLFCRSSQILHDQFLGDETLTDVTLRNHQTVVCAHQNACHHTFFQRSCKSNASVGIPSRDDADFYIQTRCKDALKEQSINLL